MILFLTRRTRPIAVTILFLWCSVLNFPSRTQALTLWKPCFAETDELPAPPLSQTGLSDPSLWLEKDIYDDVIQDTKNPALGNSAGSEAVDTEVDEEIEAQLEEQKLNQSPTETVDTEVEEEQKLNQSPTETVDTEVEVEIEAQLEEQKLTNLPPIDLIEPENSLLKTWFIQNQKFPQFYSNSAEDNLVTLVVDRNQWQAERYMGQYVFINRFGTTAREYEYNLRVCNDKGESVGYYFCQLSQSPLQLEDKGFTCQVSLRSEGFRLRDFRVFEILDPE
ncbi:MAG: hypothetical protein WBA77_11255 [Microcoleaceae cyanobacterium]